MGATAGRRVLSVLGVLTAALLAVMLAAAPMRAARAHAAPPRPAHLAALTKHLGAPAPHQPVRVLTPRYFDKHVVDAFLPSAATCHQTLVVPVAERHTPAHPSTRHTDVCSRGPPAGEPS